MAAKMTNKSASINRRNQKTSKVAKKQLAKKPKKLVEDILPRRIKLIFKEDIKPKRIRLLVREPAPPKERIVIRIPAKYLIKTEDEKI